MNSAFSLILAELRRERDLSQRKAAADLGISQALLSHYENGLREPKLDFVIKACDYYGVSADYMLGRTGKNGGEELQRLAKGLKELSGLAEQLLHENTRITGKDK
ncbi:MAG: helix-turn-helix domain-containing protein [Oscillospiraceae bacterium]